MSHLDRFLDGYIECAFWSSVHYASEDAEGVPFDTVDAELSDEARRQMREDCAAFIDANKDDLEGIDATQAGHDFWLTRNRHGAGFWDRGLGERGDRLTHAAHVYGECDLYLGDDGMVYVQ